MSEKEKLELTSKTSDQTTDLLKLYHDSKAGYERLADEVAYTLEKRLRANKIPVAHVSKRLKTFESLAEKLERKHYDDPWKDVSDIAGVRVVYLYASSRSQIETLIEKEFKIKEKVDKIGDLQDNQFGYGALHYIVSLGDGAKGARYEDLKDLVCEIQVRTIMQDAWALIDHHLVYKNEQSIPSKFKRRLNTISGMFENIDDQFDRMRIEREAYLKEVSKQSQNSENFLEQEINFDTMTAFLKDRFPNLRTAIDNSHVNRVVKRLSEFGFKNLADVDLALKRTKKARQAFSAEVPANNALAEVNRAAGLVKPIYRKTILMTPKMRNIYKDSEQLVEKE